MINLDTRLLDLIPKIGPDAFVVLLLIAKRVNKDSTAFPSHAVLKKETGFGRDKIFNCLNILVEHKLISKVQRFVDGRFSSNLYTVETEYLGVYVSAKGQAFEDKEKPYTENQEQYPKNQYTEKPYTEKPYTKYYSDPIEVLNKQEVLKNTVCVKDENLKFFEEAFSQGQTIQDSKASNKINSSGVGTSRRNARPVEYTEEFLQLWVLYGKTGAKSDAQKALNNAIQRNGDKMSQVEFIQKLKDVIPKYLRSERVLKGFKKDFSTWLNGDCWDSYYHLAKIETVEELKERVENSEQTRQFLETEKKWAEIRERNRIRQQALNGGKNESR